MPGIVALVAAISDDVVASLATAGYPALNDGAILLGKQHQFEQSAPPRIIFTPVSSAFEMKDIASASRGQGYTAEQLRQIRNRALVSDEITFEVRCWGVSSDQDPDDDYDFTQALYQQVIRTVHLLTVGTYKLGGGNWTDSSFQSGQLVRDGREFVFKIAIGTPIQALLESLPLAPSNVSPENTTTLRLPTGETGIGCADSDD